MIELRLVVKVLFCVHISMGVDVADLDNEAGSLQYVHVLHRNGETSIDKGYESDSFKEEKFWPEEMGKLTSKGILDQHRLGIFLGERYSDLISGRQYNRKQFQAYSSPTEENYLSAMALSQGIYLTTWSDAINENMKWIPINVLEDKTLQLKDLVRCPAYEDSKRVFHTSREYQIIREKYQDILKGAANYMGMDEKDVNLTDLPKLWNHFLIESNYNRTLEGWPESVYPQTLQEPVSIAYVVPTWTADMKKAVTGRFLNTLFGTLTRREDAPDTTNNPLITAFSTDDFSIAAVLDVLGVFNSMPVPFDATIMIEMRKRTDQNFTITILYSNETIAEGKEKNMYILKMPNCSEVCPLGTFKDQISPYIIDDWESFCNNGDLNQSNMTRASQDYCTKFGWWLITVPVAVGVIAILIILAVVKKMTTRGTLVMNNPKKGDRNRRAPDPNEAATFFVKSLDDIPSMLTDPAGGCITPYDIFTLPPPFILPPEMTTL